MERRRLAVCWWVPVLLLGLLPVASLADDAPASAFAAACEARLVFVRAHLPDVVAAAETVADRWVEKKQVLLHYPFGGDVSSFSMEFTSRAGGLANAQPSTVRVKMRSANDVVVYGVRSWEKGGAFFAKDAAAHRQEGRLIVVFASQPPTEIAKLSLIDVLVDNGAPTADESQAALNQAVNVVNGWLWTCELTAALTRRGVRPGILLGMVFPGSVEQLKEYQHPEPTLYPCDTPIPPRQLSEQYLGAIERCIADLKSPSMREQIAKAADLAAAKLKEGHRVWMSSSTHLLDGEVFLNNLAPTGAFRGISCGRNGERFLENAKPGDLLFWFGEWTLNLPWRDYLAIIRQTGADYIPCWRRTVEPMEGWDHPDVYFDQKVDDAAMVLEQRWPFENAGAKLPFNPGRIAPISGFYVCLQYRMLDEAIARRLPAK